MRQEFSWGSYIDKHWDRVLVSMLNTLHFERIVVWRKLYTLRGFFFFTDRLQIFDPIGMQYDTLYLLPLKRWVPLWRMSIILQVYLLLGREAYMMESHRMIDRKVQNLVIFMMGRRERSVRWLQRSVLNPYWLDQVRRAWLQWNW